ncbi:HAD hydrolase family protein, partial [Salmonella enterica]|uniref:HAD hydrolase family protein n=1 Tax=Salmonella enterica TaxID=28901 RepID=UPI0032982A49
MRYRLIAFDLDGTLLNRNKQILPESLTPIRQMQDMGCRIMLVTGRCHREAKAYYKTQALTEPKICCKRSY